MKMRLHHASVLLSLGVILLGTAAWSAIFVPTAAATCGTGSNVVITDPGPSTTTPSISGVHTLHAYSTPTTASGLTFMLMSPSQQPIGEATQSGSDWRLDWDSRNVPNGSYQLIAVAHFGSVATLDCASPAQAFYVANVANQSPALQATITPGTWSGYAGQSGTFSLDALYTDQYGRQAHVTSAAVGWHTSLGVLGSQAGYSTVLNAGPSAGTGMLGADVSYSGLVAHATAALKVSLPSTSGGTGSSTPTSGSGSGPTTSPSPSPSATASGDTSATGDTERLATMPTIFRPQSPTNSVPVVALPTLSCLEKKIGKERFDQISSGKTEPTPEERRAGANCFSGAQPIPAVLAPVAPAHLQEVELTHDIVSVSGVKNETVTGTDGKKVTGLLINGKGTPNANVFIYIFSDPMVLRAQTDGQGKWSYVLQNPLKPGHHEIYAVAEKDSSSFVRTSAVPVSIAAAAPGSADGSLVVEQSLQPAQIAYIAGGVLMVLVAAGMLLRLRRRAKLVRSSTPAQIIMPTPPPGPPTDAPQA